MADTHTYPASLDNETASGDGDEWLSIGEAARRAGLSVDTLRRYDGSGRLRASRTPGHQRRYLRSQIDAAFPRPETAAAPLP